MSAILLIDLQTDFFDPRGPLRDKHLEVGPFLGRLPGLLGDARRAHTSVVWIRSEYQPRRVDTERDLTCLAPFTSEPTYAQTEDTFLKYVQSTHISNSNRFCTPGTGGANIHPQIAKLIQKQTQETKRPDAIITKTWYSAFTDTALLETLQRNNITQLCIAGITTNTCVAATAIHAIHAKVLGFNVSVITDCVTAPNCAKHETAMQKLVHEYGIRQSLYWVNGSIPSWRVMMALVEKNIPYSARRLKVMSNPRETRSEEFRAINVQCKTPAYVDTDTTTVIESLAILTYLDTFYPAIPLVPSAIRDKAAHTRCIVRTQETENLHLVFEDIELVYEENYREQAHRIVTAYKNTLIELRIWDGYLAVDKFVSGSTFTVADCAFYPIVAYMHHRGLDLTAFHTSGATWRI